MLNSYCSMLSPVTTVSSALRASCRRAEKVACAFPLGIVTTAKGKGALAITVDGMKDVDYTEDNAGLLLIARLAPVLLQGLGVL